MLSAVLNKSWKQHLYCHLTPISQTIQVRQDMLSTVRKPGTNMLDIPVLINQLCVDTWCCLDDQPRAMADRDGW